MAEVVVFSCKKCGRLIKATDDYAGYVIECPNCGQDLVVPGRDAPPAEPVDRGGVSVPIVDALVAEEREALEQEDPQLVAHLGSLQPSQYWEFALLARMLRSRLTALTACVGDSSRRQAVCGRLLSSRRRRHRCLNERVAEFFDILNSVYMIIDSDLRPAMNKRSVFSIVNFVNRMQLEVDRLQHFHEAIHADAYPAATPYLELTGIMHSWAPHCCAAVAAIADYFEAHAGSPRSAPPKTQLQVSLMPPSLHRFFMYKCMLEKKRVFSR